MYQLTEAQFERVLATFQKFSTTYLLRNSSSPEPILGLVGFRDASLLGNSDAAHSTQPRINRWTPPAGIVAHYGIAKPSTMDPSLWTIYGWKLTRAASRSRVVE